MAGGWYARVLDSLARERRARGQRERERQERLALMVDRGGNRCVWCGRQFVGSLEPTTEHLVPRFKGGPSWIENEVAACRRCSGERGVRGLVDWYDECERRGWVPDLVLLREALDELLRVLDERGGHGRARVYVAFHGGRLANREPPTLLDD
jgi:hypothetical protein